MRTWKLHKAHIFEIFHAVKPELDAYHAKREGNRAGLVNAQANATATRRLNAIRENTARAQARHLELPAAGMQPRREANATPRPAAPDKRPDRPKFAPAL
jgi:hypothetical protein